MDKKYCEYCEGLLREEDQVCPFCGAPVTVRTVKHIAPKPEPAPVRAEERPSSTVNVNVNVNAPAREKPGTQITVSDRSWPVLFLLCLFLGVIGVHRFYVGKIGTGLIWLFTGGLMGVGILIDLVVILLRLFKDKNGLRVMR